MTKTPISLQSIVAQSPDLVGTNIEDHTAILSITNGNYYSLGPVASRVWQLIEQPRSAAAVVGQLLTEYAVERAVCEQQVLAFLQELADAELVTVQ